MAGTMLGSEEEAEDTLQDAFCRLWPRRDEIRSETEAKALLTTTVRHLSIDHLRQRKRDEIMELDELGDEPPDETHEEAAEREQRFRDIEAIVAQHLTPLCREILRRKEFEGQDYDTIAAELNMQPAAVRMNLSRARNTIRECYRKLYSQ